MHHVVHATPNGMKACSNVQRRVTPSLESEPRVRASLTKTSARLTELLGTALL